MKPNARFLLSRSYAALDEIRKVSNMLSTVRDDHFEAFEQSSELLETVVDNLEDCENAIKVYLDDHLFWQKAIQNGEE